MNYNAELDKEYLSRKTIEVNFSINNNYIKIDNNHTTYCDITRIQNLICKNEILKLYKAVYQLAKQKNVKIGRKNGYKKFIVENWNSYLQLINYYNRLFDEIIKDFKEVEKRKLHSGTIDDQVLNAAQHKSNKYKEVFYNNSIYSQMICTNLDFI